MKPLRLPGGRGLSRLLLAWLAIVPLQVWAVPADEPAMPSLPAPPHIGTFDVGNQMRLQGVPVRIKGFVSGLSVPELSRWYRNELGGSWVENKVGSKTVLGQRQGTHFVTVELESLLGSPSGSTTKVVTAVMSLQPKAVRSGPMRDGVGNWASQLPLSSQVLGHLADSTDTHESVHLVAVNPHSLDFNVQHFRHVFQEKGFLEEPVSPVQVEVDRRRASWAASTVGSAERLAFRDAGTEALVILGRDRAGRSTLVLVVNRRK